MAKLDDLRSGHKHMTRIKPNGEAMNMTELAASIPVVRWIDTRAWLPVMRTSWHTSHKSALKFQQKVEYRLGFAAWIE